MPRVINEDDLLECDEALDDFDQDAEDYYNSEERYLALLEMGNDE